MSTNLDIKLKKANKVYHEGEKITGVIFIQSTSDIKHDGITLAMEGTVNLQLSAKNVGIFEAFYNSVKPNSSEKAVPHPVKFTITPESLQNIKDKGRIPRFLVSGHLDSTMCCITKPFTGELVVEHCEVPIKSVELQLVRVETCGCAEGYARDATEIQNIQIGEGNVPCGLAIPIYMIFPRLFTCPTLATSNFKVDFEVNIVIIFQDDHLITENFRIVLTRY
ncbi:vacuolar protein sorting-associated protein 26C isoform X2 [Schistocerca serialis cubense]|uniref:vacuolar protein sorting-associated protein 26C isoform X2 n=1 Tax=Schistocerca nitens TaxID=7011 RepID=UPI0021193B4F|nr:vacuolar protein sorting-associated protein 26C isoform X2 [Schistocerca nitens]XP_049960838.1 vacuolar protein sorting-associated protein 26C isoform X2 [Schistocerca serialis cubense]